MDPVTFFVMLLVSVTFAVLAELLAPKPDIQNAKPSGRGDFSVPTAIQNRVVPLLWGTGILRGPNVTWYGDFRQMPIRETIRTGMFSKKRITTGFRIYVSMDMAFCRGGVVPVIYRNILAKKKVIPGALSGFIDEQELWGGNEFGNGGLYGEMTLYDGNDTQLADPYLLTVQSPVSGQRGTAHAVWVDFYWGNTTRIEPVAAELSRFPNRLLVEATSQGQAGDYVAGEEIINTLDANPAEVLYEYFIDDDWGRNYSPNRINLANFAQVAHTLKGEGNGFSLQWEQARVGKDFINMLLEQIGGTLYTNELTGQINVTIARNDYVVNTGVSFITGSNTFNVASGGTNYSVGQTIFSDGFDNGINNGRKTVTARTATTVTVAETLIDETPSGDVFGGPRISELNGVTVSNSINVKSFKRQTWNGTANQMRVEFTDRDGGYVDTYARADNLANQRVQGEIIIATKKYPGVKVGAVANNLAAREMRFLSFPLASTVIICNRDFWDAQPGQPIRWTNERAGFIDLVMRIVEVDDGRLGGNITLTLLQDVFSLETGFFGDPPTSLWTRPVQLVGPIETIHHAVFEAPKAIVDRSILFPGVPDRVFASVRGVAQETALLIYTKNDVANPPTGDYQLDGQNEGLLLIGTLNIALDATDANPTATIQIQGTPDSKALIQQTFDTTPATDAEIGEQLANVIMIGGEFLGVQSQVDAGGNLTNFVVAHRGLMDSVPATHGTSALVFLLYVSGGLNDSPITPGNYVSVQPRTVSRDEELSEANSKTFTFLMDNRYRRPYAPYRYDVNTVRFASAPSLDAVIVNPDGDDVGIDVLWYRRDFETSNEVTSLTDDAGVLDAGFQAKHNHEGRLSVGVIDGDGLTLDAGSGAFVTGRSGVVSRADFLGKLDGVVPTSAIVSILARHTLDAVVRESRVALEGSIAPTSAELAGLVNLGTAFASGAASRAYTAISTFSHTLVFGTAITGAEFRLNGGAWTAIASLAGTAVVINDTLEFRHSDNSAPPTNTVAILSDKNARAYIVFNTETEFEGLMAYWTMNEISTGVSATARAARFGGMPSLSDIDTCESGAGKFSNGVRCRDNGGTQEHLSLSNADYSEFTLDYSRDWTVSLWVNSASGTLSSHFHGFVFHGVWPGGAPSISDRAFVIGASTSGGYVAITYHGAGVQDGRVDAGLAFIEEDADKLLTLVYDTSANQIEFFVDGISRGTDTTSGVMNVPATTEPLLIGGVNRAVTGGDVSVTLGSEDTVIDDVRLYNRALGAPEILSMFNAAQPLT